MTESKAKLVPVLNYDSDPRILSGRIAPSRLDDDLGRVIMVTNWKTRFAKNNPSVLLCDLTGAVFLNADEESSEEEFEDEELEGEEDCPPVATHGTKLNGSAILPDVDPDVVFGDKSDPHDYPAIIDSAVSRLSESAVKLLYKRLLRAGVDQGFLAYVDGSYPPAFIDPKGGHY